MCWKTSSPAPEPTPAAMPLSSATEATALQGAVSCPTHTYSCNSTDIMCHNGGLVCCTEHDLQQTLCSCPKGYEAPNCLYQTIDDLHFESRFDSMSTAGKAGIIAFIVIVVLAFVITVVVLVIRRQRRSRRLEGHKDENVALRGNATRVDPEKQGQGNQDVGRGASGNDRNGS